MVKEDLWNPLSLEGEGWGEGDQGLIHPLDCRAASHFVGSSLRRNDDSQ